MKKLLVFLGILLTLVVSCKSEEKPKSSQELLKEYKEAVSREKKVSERLPTFNEARIEAYHDYNYNGHIYYENGHKYILHQVEWSSGCGLTSVHDPECEMSDIKKLLEERDSAK